MGGRALAGMTGLTIAVLVGVVLWTVDLEQVVVEPHDEPAWPTASPQRTAQQAAPQEPAGEHEVAATAAPTARPAATAAAATAVAATAAAAPPATGQAQETVRPAHGIAQNHADHHLDTAKSLDSMGMPEGAHVDGPGFALPDGYVPQPARVVDLATQRAKLAFARQDHADWVSSVEINRDYNHLFRRACVTSNKVFMFGVSPEEQKRISARYNDLKPPPSRPITFVESVAKLPKNRAGDFYVPGRSVYGMGTYKNIMHVMHEIMWRIDADAVLANKYRNDPEVPLALPASVDSVVLDSLALDPDSALGAAMGLVAVNLLHKEINKAGAPFPVIYRARSELVCADEILVSRNQWWHFVTMQDIDPATLSPFKEWFKGKRHHPDGKVVMHAMREMTFATYRRPMPAARECLRKAVVYDHSTSFHSVLQNGQEVSEHLANLGMDVVYFKDMHLVFPATLDLMADTDLFLSPSGGVMSDAMFMPNNTAIIEVCTGHRYSWLQRWGVTALMQLQHIVLPGHEDPKLGKGFGTISTGKIDEALAKIASNNGPAICDGKGSLVVAG